MYKKIVVVVILLMLVTGCNNKVEEEKNEYLDTKAILETNSDFSDMDSFPCEVTVSLDRVDEESISYNVLFHDARENMNNLKILVIHNQYTEEVFPYIGLMDSKSRSLMINSEDNKEINIKGSLESTNDIDDLDLEFRIWMEYVDDSGDKHTVFYKTTI